MEKEKILYFAMLLIIVITIRSALSDVGQTEKERAISCINESKLIASKLEKENFSTNRLEEKIKEAKLMYSIQEEMERRGLRTDYKKIIEYCNEIKRIDESSHLARDQIVALKKFYKEYGENLKSEEIEKLFSEIEKEMKNERYELIPEIIEKIYSAISEEQAKRALLVTYYSATTKGIKSFLKERKIEIGVGLVAIFIAYLLFNKTIRKHIIKKKINKLKQKREKLKEMIAQNQNNYFNKGKISQMGFEIRNKKLAETIRDINRQIPLLEEELKKISGKNEIANSANRRR